jgi:hypothetical protein
MQWVSSPISRPQNGALIWKDKRWFVLQQVAVRFLSANIKRNIPILMGTVVTAVIWPPVGGLMVVYLIQRRKKHV